MSLLLKNLLPVWHVVISTSFIHQGFLWHCRVTTAAPTVNSPRTMRLLILVAMTGRTGFPRLLWDAQLCVCDRAHGHEDTRAGGLEVQIVLPIPPVAPGLPITPITPPVAIDSRYILRRIEMTRTLPLLFRSRDFATLLHASTMIGDSTRRVHVFV